VVSNWARAVRAPAVRYLVGGLLVVAAYMFVPLGVPKDVIYFVIGLSCVVAIVRGVRRHAPRNRLGWYLMAAGNAAWVIGDALYSYFEDVALVSPFPSVADVFYLAAYPLLALGVLSLLTSVGYFLALRRVGVSAILTLLTSADIALNGVQTLWAGMHPLPDPRHAGHPVFVTGMLALPVLITLSLWRRASPRLRAYFVATLLLLATMIPIFTGLTNIDRAAYRGLIQRVYTLTVFPPVAVGAWVLARRVRERGT